MSDLSTPPSSSSAIHKKIVTAVVFLVGIAAGYGIFVSDVILRARHAYFEGEKYLSWHKNPVLKKSFYDAWYQQKKGELDKALSASQLNQDEYNRRLEGLDFDRTFRMEESSIKYAVQWYRDAVELFSPPRSKWVKLSEEKIPLAMKLWKEELSEKKIPHEEYMLE